MKSVRRAVRKAEALEEEKKRENEVDEASSHSFPASDPASSTTVHAGPPNRAMIRIAGLEVDAARPAPR